MEDIGQHRTQYRLRTQAPEILYASQPCPQKLLGERGLGDVIGKKTLFTCRNGADVSSLDIQQPKATTVQLCRVVSR